MVHNSGTGGVSQVDGGHVGIGTTNPDIAVHTANTKKLNVGIVTANSIYASNFYGDGSNLTGITVPGGATGLDLDDNVKIRFGTNQDGFDLYHNGNNSLIQDSGTGHIQIRSGTFTVGNFGLTKTSAVFNSGSGQQLNFNNVQKFITTNTGVVISGICTATSFSGTVPSSSLSGALPAISGANLTNLPPSAPVGGASTNTVFFENDKLVEVNYQITSTKNAMSAGPISVSAGIAVTIPSGCSWTIV